MALHRDVIAEVLDSPDGPSVGALFDFDGTVIYGFSAIAFIREQVKRGDLSPRDFMELAGAMTSFGMGNMGFSAMMVATSQFMGGISEQSYVELGQELYKKHLAKLIYPESRALIEAHQSKGHTVAVISSATPYQVEPAARDLGIEHIMCTRLEVKDGMFTGGVERPTCFGPGKVDAAEGLAARQGVDLQQSFFYSDSDDDLELLERVGIPRPLNPNRKLTSIAEQRGWPIRRFASRGRPGVMDWTRSIAATGSLLTSFAAGLPIWALTGSKRRAQNFSTSLFADTASALIGLNLDITGEKNLWATRPAVFVFNHQSKADVVIMTSLLRRDIAGVGKKEIKKIPLIGQVMEFGGAVLIDRENAGSAIEAMKPLVDAMRVEGKSVILAPEGTRTVSPRLGPFKKGAFHLAMQAGVPIVPIVIHNALDVAPKGDFIFRAATVEVEVLDAVDTSDWTVATINQHVAEVRQLFLDALGQSASKQDAAVTTKAKPKPKAKTKAKSKAKAKAKGKPKAKTKAKTKAKAKDQPKPKAKAKTKAKTKATARPKAKPKLKARPKTQSAAKPTRPRT
jgi:putative phosphoserine phosphatase/1-acylglycerol-3-phosphate O-acyltransferase